MWYYVASEASETIATKLLERIEKATRLLLTAPFAGAARSQLADGLRVIFEGNYAIYYTVSETEIIIIRVLHGARDANTLAERGGFE
ncbi:MAG: type II toxin-antitoxin system RelE/ParE family toxin [Nostoc sp.]|uniref:type II toxin-antitoxin system RelE/ParE family toxin n=1 Tax=Nostoc sp. TaxID=1180 RepID=UPI002FF44403